MNSSPKKLSIFGLGYVGSVSAACFANTGHVVIGVEPLRNKVDLINRGISPIVENGLDELLRKAVKDGHLRATNNAAEAVEESEISIVCVSTPSRPNGDVDVTRIETVYREIGEALGPQERFSRRRQSIDHFARYHA